MNDWTLVARSIVRKLKSAENLPLHSVTIIIWKTEITNCNN